MITKITNKRFTNFYATIGIKRLKEADIIQQKRIKYAHLVNTALLDRVSISTPKIIEGGNHAYWNYPILAENRSAVLKKLIRHGIDGKKIDAYNCAQFEIFKDFKGRCPVTNSVSKRVFALPIYHYLKEDDVHFMNKALIEADGK